MPAALALLEWAAPPLVRQAVWKRSVRGLASQLKKQASACRALQPLAESQASRPAACVPEQGLSLLASPVSSPLVSPVSLPASLVSPLAAVAVALFQWELLQAVQAAALRPESLPLVAE